jgi:hypothetical protein
MTELRDMQRERQAEATTPELRPEVIQDLDVPAGYAGKIVGGPKSINTN